MKITVTLVIDQIENVDNDISGNDNNNDDDSGASNKELSRNEMMKRNLNKIKHAMIICCYIRPDRHQIPILPGA